MKNQVSSPRKQVLMREETKGKEQLEGTLYSTKQGWVGVDGEQWLRHFIVS